ncbi:MAG: alpha-L-arabinofuranosidase C-terminal domain-containing protein [Pseudomonadota bacterium]
MSDETLKAAIHIDPSQSCGDVHDHLYGANLEHIGRSVYQGHWAEMLRNRKFLGHDKMFVGMSEGLSHQNPSYGVVTPWTALSPDYHGVLYVHDNTTFFTGNQSQRITIRRADGAMHGVQQDGLNLVAGRAYHVRLTLKGQGQRVEVRLGTALWDIVEVGADWQDYETILSVSSDAENAAFSVAHAAEGDLWIGCASVMPAQTLDGHRPDVVAALRDWGPTFLRWPGGNFASAYHWQDGVGPRDQRPGYLDPAWNTWEPHDVGTDEFLALCRHVETEPILTINMGNGTPDEAAAWVEYCNGGTDTKMGQWRARNGHPEPYNVKTWFVGNEQFGNWQVGTCDAETYGRRYREFAAAMLAADPSLDLIAVGAPTDLYGHWNELVLKTAPEITKLSVHYYSIRTEKWTTPPPAHELYWPKVAAAHEVTEMLDHTWDIVRAHADPPPAIIFDEWNTYVEAKTPDFFEDYGMADALYAGALMNACLARADWIKMSASFNLINVMGNIRVSQTHVWKTPTFLVLELFTKHRGSHSVACRVEVDSMATPAAGNLPAYDAVPLVDAAATRSADGGMLFLSVVNRDPERAAEISLSGLTRTGSGRIHFVAGPGPQSLNTEYDPDAVGIEEAAWPDATQLTIPAHAVALVEVPLEGAA